MVLKYRGKEKGHDKMPTLNPSLEAQILALWKVVNERDERYKVQFVTLGQAAELNNRAVQIAMDAADKAVTKSEAAVEKRFESVNEFRAQMGDMQTTFARTDMVMSKFSSIEKDIDDITKYQTSQSSSVATLGKLWGYVVGLIGLGVAIAAFVFR